ncbi:MULTISPECIES: phosphotransferase [Pontibacillus]|uniref:Phosphotransferase n=1 Tax=Pontibacillus chungwhensis TaxID=265426 RepID=A0ABY8UXE5_9BACI|nr:MULTISPECIES: phosphotransferase [Pontibacillus]MCD5323710.1 aminoglycoside phosphotransferase family protein [Pontibacillus sp. HN14]WIF97075.1 phosphotransferase [Pontibacillus chungwhensis]
MGKHVKGEVQSDFPFSFLETKAGLSIQRIERIKPHVVKVYTGSRWLIVKRYTSVHSVEHQWELFKAISANSALVPFIPFPSGDLWIRDGYGATWTLAPYIRGDSLNYKRKADREVACNVLGAFHQQAKGIEVDSLIVKQPLYMHWKKRFRHFGNHYKVFKQYGYGDLYNSLIHTSSSLYDRFIQLDWYALEKRALDNRSWVHGDVAAHNFIRAEHNNVYLIDFDLASQSPRVYDWIQIGQRFLPFLEGAEEIVSIENRLNEEEIPFFRLGLAIPAALVREWNTFMKEERSVEEIQFYLQVLSERWQKQLSFVEQNKLMLT